MRKDAAAAKGASLSQDADKVLSVAKDPSVAGALKHDRAHNLAYLQEHRQLTSEQIDALYHYGYHRYASGNYAEAATCLYHYYALSPDGPFTESVLWGRLASDTMTDEWEKAVEDVRLLREHIDGLRPTLSVVVGGNGDVTYEAVLQKRVWLLHWSLFVWAKHPAGRAKLVELFLSPSYLSAVQTSSSWLLRYLVVALIITRRSARNYLIESGNGQSKLTTNAALRDLSRTIQSEAHRLHADPFVEFFRQLYIELDLDRAQTELEHARDVAKTDYFIREHADEFVENARVLVTEVYSRIHQKVQIADLSRFLLLSEAEGNAWIAAHYAERQDAKVDLDAGVVTFTQPHPSVYQTVIEKTRSISTRTSMLVQATDHYHTEEDDAEEGEEGEEPAGEAAPEAAAA